MAAARRAHRLGGDAVTGSPFHITGLSVRFDDDDLEARFAHQQMPLQRRTTAVITLVLVALALVQWPLRALMGDHTTAAESLFLAGAAAVSIVFAAVLWQARSDAAIGRTLLAAAVVLPGVIGVVISAGAPVGAQPVLVIAGGAIIAYFSSKLDFLSTVLASLWYSVVAVGAWLACGPAADRIEVGYVITATVAAHIAGIAEARRLHRDLRTTFAQREDLRQLSAIDVLTGLANRRAFDERLAGVWRSWQATGRTPTVMMLDIDHFKRLNDTLGHQAGDVALREVADAIRTSLRKGSDHVVARYGGEEFVILLPFEDHRVAHAIADRIGASVRGAGIERSVVPRDSELDRYEHPVTVSIGIAAARATMTAPQDLVDAADRAMYVAKGAGRDCVRCLDDDGRLGDPVPSLRG